ncbi:MAG TPA: hypothetical protein VFI25_17215 [Planctomycetota bacterium]|nr:hypothetical protein [Planctomycetota bacterium]
MTLEDLLLRVADAFDRYKIPYFLFGGPFGRPSGPILRRGFPRAEGG